MREFLQTQGSLMYIVLKCLKRTNKISMHCLFCALAVLRKVQFYNLETYFRWILPLSVALPAAEPSMDLSFQV